MLVLRVRSFASGDSRLTKRIEFEERTESARARARAFATKRRRVIAMGSIRRLSLRIVFANVSAILARLRTRAFCARARAPRDRQDVIADDEMDRSSVNADHGRA